MSSVSRHGGARAWYVPHVDFEALTQCTELRDVHIVSAVRSSEAMEALLARFSIIAAPGKGAPIVMAVFARLGTTACDWIDGELRVEIWGDTTQTKLRASASIGGGFSEKLFADTVLRVPFEEFLRGIARAPKLIEPLKVMETGKRIVLTVSHEVRRTSLPPPMIGIDPRSLMMVPAAPPMPPVALSHAPKPPSAPPKIVLRRRAKPAP